MNLVAPLAAFVALASACSTADRPQPAIAYPTDAYVNPFVAYDGLPPPGVSALVPPPLPPLTSMPRDPRPPALSFWGGSVMVTTDRKVDRPTRVIGPIETDEASGNRAAAVAVLRDRARVMGADAVIGVEIAPADGGSGAVHASGLAVRYVEPSPSASPSAAPRSDDVR